MKTALFGTVNQEGSVSIGTLLVSCARRWSLLFTRMRWMLLMVIEGRLKRPNGHYLPATLIMGRNGRLTSMYSCTCSASTNFLKLSTFFKPKAYISSRNELVYKAENWSSLCWYCCGCIFSWYCIVLSPHLICHSTVLGSRIGCDDFISV